MNINLSLIEAVSAHLVEALGDDFDLETFMDSLDGETDAADIIDSLLADMQADEALANAIKAQTDDLSARRKRIEDRARARKNTLKLVLDATGQKKVERPLATVSRLKGRASVQIINEADIPTQLCKTTVTPDKTAIKKQIDAGETVPGAQLVVGPDSISVRVK